MIVHDFDLIALPVVPSKADAPLVVILGERPRDHIPCHSHGPAHVGAMPLSVSSLIAVLFFDRCARPMPRNTFGALLNWTFSYATISIRLPHGSRKSRNGPGRASTPASANALRAASLLSTTSPK